MVENFYLDDVRSNKNFQHPLKLSFKGASIFELNDLVNLAIRSNKKLKNIIIGVDNYAFNEALRNSYLGDGFPKYLYDNDSMNEFSYLLNFKIFDKSIHALTTPYDAKRINSQLNKLYSWQAAYNSAFTIKNVLLSYEFHKKEYDVLNEKMKKKFVDNYNNDELHANFKNELLSIIQANPNINFYLFYPPYSIYSYKNMEHSNVLEANSEFKRYIYSQLKPYKNVKLFDFQVASSVIEDLSNYKDAAHYHERINHWMLQEFQKDSYLVNDKNINTFVDKMYYYGRDYKVK